MARYLLRRVVQGLFAVLGVLLLLFVLFFLVTTPEDAALKALGEKASPAALEQWKVNHGYDKALFWSSEDPTDTMLFDHFRRMLTFDFGRSDADDMPIGERLRQGILPTLALTVPLFVLGLGVSLALSLLAAFVRDTTIDRGILLLCVVTMSVSTLLYIVGAQYTIGRLLRWFPISGFDPSPVVLGRLLALPVIVGVLTGFGGDVRFYRTVFLEEARRDYVRTARAKGCSRSRVMLRHVLRNAMIPVSTRVAITIPFLFTGSILLESFFGIPGLGSITVEAINGNDFATLRVVVFVGSLIFILVQLLMDIGYTLIDPRVKLE